MPNQPNCRFPDWHRGCPHPVKAFRVTGEDGCQFDFCGDCKNYAVERWPGGEGVGEELTVGLIGRNPPLTNEEGRAMGFGTGDVDVEVPDDVERGIEQ